MYTKGEVDTSQALQDAAIAGKLPREGESFVIDKVTSDAVTNGTNLLGAYATAAAKTPDGQALSATNRVAVLVLSGQYDLGTDALLMDTEFVDLVGVSSQAEGQVIYGAANGPGTGVLMQTADDVRIEHLHVRCTATSGTLNDDTDPAAYYAESIRPLTRIRNCTFWADDSHAWSMRRAIEYSRTYEDCTGSVRAFGGGGGTASGTFTNCTGGDYALSSGGAGEASGTFTDCAGGNYAFAGNSGTASGTFTNCTGGERSFGGGGGSVTSAARLYGCRMTGDLWEGTMRGRMDYCHWAHRITCGETARLYNSTFLGNVNLDNTAAGIAFCSVQGSINNDGSASFIHGNLEDPDVE